MNVLVYSGAGSTADSVKHCLETLRRFLSPYYAVTSVDAKVLKYEPWQSKTSLLVFPGGADLPMCREFNGEGNKIIKDWVRAGGKYIGFCAGGYYGSSRCEFEVGNPQMEVSGPRELKFFPGIARGCAYKGFVYDSEIGSKAVELTPRDQLSPSERIFNYYNGGAVFVNAEDYENTEILASYKIPVDVACDSNRAAVILCKVGKGAVLLSGTHPEFTPELMRDENYASIIETLRKFDHTRIRFFKKWLTKLGLKVNDEATSRPRLTPLLLTSMKAGVIPKLIQDWQSKIGFEQNNLLRGNNDTFRIHEAGKEYTNLSHLSKQEEFEDPDTAIKELEIFPEYEVADRKLTPYFNLQLYYSVLSHLSGGDVGDLGTTLVYGEVVTSTSTMIDKNINILKCLPHGYTMVGTTQVSGRGRGGNIWVNPPGVLAFSQVLKLPLQAASTSPIVFIQYLVSLAMVEAVLNYGNVVSESGQDYSFIPVRIKWPNDIYLLKPEFFGKEETLNEADPAYVKVCGILINTNILDGQYYLVSGTGINVSNSAPTTSLNLLLEKINQIRSQQDLKPLELFSTEKLLANYMYIFDKMFTKFRSTGFDQEFLDLYYKRWLHSGQVVTIDSNSHVHQNNSLGRKVRAKITGITNDWGMLVAEEIDWQNCLTGSKFELQPDGNSFDMFKGLISRKKS
ncbi:hypothetical protein PACTADRAFT_46022 [Pachysolen tannophilus NRRL Y-2460]|uniref:BPL/LPL catalytic domain-containing protein n=1 Tax=Pachysolen tannophilus NRRL Y-2460 TaxID=669874 RepID=A0A1E4TPY2_PACTA|nr:hypothetical protein PACTADRAFT_46022 [Pachysolen tannophilus NRRL Y-2460]